MHSVNATPVPPIHWPSALVGLVLAVCVVVGVSWLAAPRRAVQPLAVVSAQAQAPAPTPAPQVQPTPIPAPTMVEPEPPLVERVKVAFTNGRGVNLRAGAGEREKRLKTLPEGTTLEIIGADETAGGMTWRNVRDATGTSGWVAGSFVTGVQP